MTGYRERMTEITVWCPLYKIVPEIEERMGDDLT